MLQHYEEYQFECAAFLTACNPFSEIAAEQKNEFRQTKLAHELTKRGLHFLPGIDRDPLGHWPGEPSFLVFDLSLDAVKKLGRQQAQNALIWYGADAVPQLVVLR